MLDDDGGNISHRHDQSLLGIAYHFHPKGVALVSAEREIFKNYLKYHHRHPDQADHSLVGQADLGIRNWEFKIIDLAVFRKIADWVYAASGKGGAANSKEECPIQILEAGSREV
ncbi:MAG: hypothetical protein WCG05_04630 [Alphaproteobacteria bacterium]